MKTFQSKFQLWKKQLRNDNTFHFPTLAGCGKPKCAPYADELISAAFISMNEEFDHRFQNFRSQESSLHMFSSPFDVNVEQAPKEFQMELIELQGNDDLKRDMKENSLLEFYKRLPEESFPKIKDLA